MAARMVRSLYARDPSLQLIAAREGSEAVLPPVAIVWPCFLSVDEFRAAGDEVVVPRPDCPSCSTPMMFWSRYSRSVREGGRCHRVRLRRARCGSCRQSHALVRFVTSAGEHELRAARPPERTADVAAGRADVSTSRQAGDREREFDHE